MSLWIIRDRQPIYYYREPSGDYLAVNRGVLSPRGDSYIYEARVAAVEGLSTSVCTAAVSRQYLQKCKMVTRNTVPDAWLQAIGLHTTTTAAQKGA